MRFLRGRAATPADDRAVTEGVIDRVGETDEPALRVWQPHRQVAFGRRDARADGYELARGLAADHGFVPTERAVGGRAVAYTGTTVAFVRAVPIEDADARTGIEGRYEAATAELADALAALGATPTVGEPAGSFCPGTHSLSAAGKLAGLAQRVRRDVAVLGGIVVVADHETVADVLEPVYAALGVAFDPATVGSLARAGAVTEPDRVVEALATALAGEKTLSTERVRPSSRPEA